jgi:enamine deaminase RidA (YjgF/YER057c/UK114 family)
MNTYSNPQGVAGPFGMYSHSCSVPANARWLAVAGQVGTDAAGNTPPGVEEQCRLAFENVRAVLVAGGMSLGDIVRMSVYLLDRADIGAYRVAREAVMGDVKPPNTLLIVASLANPIWKVEIDVLAARSDGGA